MKSPRIIAALIIALAIGGWLGWRAWQGPAVEVYVTKNEPLIQTVVATGRVISTSTSQVGAEITGVVVDRHVRDGDMVAQGDLLLTLRADDLAARVREAKAALNNLRQSRRLQANEALKQAESQLEQATREAQRRADLLKSDSISREIVEKAVNAQVVAEANLRQAKLIADALAPGGPEEVILVERLAAAQAALEKTEIRAQFPAIVLTRNVEPGDVVQPGRILMELARLGETEVLVPVDERNLGILATGQPAICIPDAYPDEQFEASVDHIAPTVDTDRGTVDVRLAVTNPPDYLRQDMTVTATIVTGRRDNALVIPNDALRAVKGADAMVQLIELGRVTDRSVKLGLRGLTHSEVLEGLSPGDVVIRTSGLSVGQRVRASDVD
ncbi:efflux RND transporter periplasmic adaptor subunit [Orrella daihaiensis]|uniref:Efflux RND transporter periplasmic adaptor subunit n=1 Tax=Orrella daihaiensis TaxID=2782176 RepID=A0ABY4AJ34_9BURK|nr:efflux RND transporter periplasmic adaptor subunit [Orrella daihaiensis]UOD50301.1 efflux RND transporter periplasmic adaptor subunit [Orrella daihaiensis]